MQHLLVIVFKSDLVQNGEVPNLVKVFSNVCVCVCALLLALASSFFLRALRGLNTLCL